MVSHSYVYRYFYITQLGKNKSYILHCLILKRTAKKEKKKHDVQVTRIEEGLQAEVKQYTDRPRPQGLQQNQVWFRNSMPKGSIYRKVDATSSGAV